MQGKQAWTRSLDRARRAGRSHEIHTTPDPGAGVHTTEWLSVWVGFGHLFLFFFCKIHLREFQGGAEPPTNAQNKHSSFSRQQQWHST